MINENEVDANVLEDIKRLSIDLVEISIAVSANRKVPMETYGSIDFFSSFGSRFQVSGATGLPLDLVMETMSPVRRKMVNYGYANVLKDIAYEIVVTRSVKDGMDPDSAIAQANQLTDINKVITTISKGTK